LATTEPVGGVAVGAGPAGETLAAGVTVAAGTDELEAGRALVALVQPPVARSAMPRKTQKAVRIAAL